MSETQSTLAGSWRGRALIFAPLVVFAVLIALFAWRLATPDDEDHAGHQIGRAAPTVDLPLLGDADGRLTNANLTAGEVTVVNFFASWCAPCRIEHADLMRLAQADRVRVVGMLYGDSPENGQAFLDELGDPYDLVGVDGTLRGAMPWGVSGVPETFVLSADGRIVYKHTGPIQNDDLVRVILPAIEQAEALGGS